MERLEKDELGKRLNDFLGSYLVVCPDCSGCATVTESSLSVKPRQPCQYLLQCSHCGRFRQVESNHGRQSWESASGATQKYWTGMPLDPHLRLPLRLQAEFRGYTFWAWNRAHLAYLESYIAAKHRPSRTAAGLQTLGMKLPEWMLSAKNRDDFGRLIEKLKMKM